MTRPREERSRGYREPSARYHPSQRSGDRRSSPRQRPVRRYQEDDYFEDDYFYEEEQSRYPRYPEYQREHTRPFINEGERNRGPRMDRQRAYESRSPYERPRPRSQPPRESPMDNRYPLKDAKKTTQCKLFTFVYNLFFYTLTIGIILSAVMFAFSEKSDAAIMGYRFYQVLTNSMAPQADSASGGFYAGDIVVVKMMDGSKVQVDDIVTFQVGEGDRYLTHRMVDRLDQLNDEAGDYIVTKGDANNTSDPPISADRVFGKVVFIIPKMGTFLAFVRENVWLCLVCVLSTFGFFLVLKAYFLQPENQSRQVKRYNHL